MAQTKGDPRDFGGFPHELLEGILIVGSGNLVHNLQAHSWGGQLPESHDWATRFEAQAEGLILAGDAHPPAACETLGPEGMPSIPAPDHLLPLLHALATRQQDDAVAFPMEGIDGGSISMLAARAGKA